MATVKCGNFAFLYDLDRALYRDLNAAERNARINYRQCGNRIRDALEKFIGIVIREKKLEDWINPKDELHYKIDDVRRHLPSEYSVSFKRENGATGNLKTFDYIRVFGNTCSHVEILPQNPKVDYPNLIKCLNVFHDALKRYFNKRLNTKVPSFREENMPIDDLVIYKAYVPADHERSKCAMEFLGYTVEDDGEKGYYSLVRMYDRRETGGAFMLRNQKCFLEVSKKFFRQPEGMAHLQELTPKESENSDFYMIRYSFHQEPHPLEKLDLGKMSIDQRLQICKKLAMCMDNLHNSKVPLYHRLFSYESVFLTEIDGEWSPYIVKFDYAKIVANRPTETVIVNTMNAKNLLTRQGREKYLPPEWQVIEEYHATANWEKVDVYSLGVLMTDILKGGFAGGIADFDDLEDDGVPGEVLDILDGMLKDSPAARSTMKAARQALCDAVR